jgi:hypothetical protein
MKGSGELGGGGVKLVSLSKNFNTSEMEGAMGDTPELWVYCTLSPHTIHELGWCTKNSTRGLPMAYRSLVAVWEGRGCGERRTKIGC